MGRARRLAFHHNPWALKSVHPPLFLQPNTKAITHSASRTAMAYLFSKTWACCLLFLVSFNFLSYRVFRVLDVMKVSGFCALLLAIGAALTFLNFSSPPVASWFPDLVFTNCSDSDKMIIRSRKLKEISSNITSNKRGDIGDVSIDDYRPIDPVPSSKASLKPGPIEHGTPLNPFIPRPSPPPMFGDSP